MVRERMTTKEASNYIGKHPQFLHNDRQQNRPTIPFIRMGFGTRGRILYKLADLQLFLAERESERDLLSVRAAALYLRISVSTLERDRNSVYGNKIPFHRIGATGKRVGYKVEDLEAYLESQYLS